MAENTEKVDTAGSQAPTTEPHHAQTGDSVAAASESNNGTQAATGDKTVTEAATDAASNAAAGASATAAGVKDNMFSMFGGGVKERKKEEVDDDPEEESGSSKKKLNKEGEEVGDGISMGYRGLRVANR